MHRLAPLALAAALCLLTILPPAIIAGEPYLYRPTGERQIQTRLRLRANLDVDAPATIIEDTPAPPPPITYQEAPAVIQATPAPAYVAPPTTTVYEYPPIYPRFYGRTRYSFTLRERVRYRPYLAPVLFSPGPYYAPDINAYDPCAPVGFGFGTRSRLDIRFRQW